MKLLFRIAIRLLIAFIGQVSAEECIQSSDAQSFSYAMAYESTHITELASK